MQVQNNLTVEETLHLSKYLWRCSKVHWQWMNTQH